MKTHKKCLLSIVLSAVILATSLPISAYAEVPNFQTTELPDGDSDSKETITKDETEEQQTEQNSALIKKSSLLVVWLVMILVVLGILMICFIGEKKRIECSEDIL